MTILDPEVDEKLAAQLARDEELRLVVYDDATGKPIGPGTLVKGHPTIGIGRALDVHGISADEAKFLNANDRQRVAQELFNVLPWANSLDKARLGVLLNMTFNMGIGISGKSGLLAFTHMLAMTMAGRYSDAADAMKLSLWHQQTGDRAKRLEEQMRTGEWQ